MGGGREEEEEKKPDGSILLNGFVILAFENIIIHVVACGVRQMRRTRHRYYFTYLNNYNDEYSRLSNLNIAFIELRTFLSGTSPCFAVYHL